MIETSKVKNIRDVNRKIPNISGLVTTSALSKKVTGIEKLLIWLPKLL